MLIRLLSLLFVILGVSLAFATYTIERNQERLRDGALRATGTVVRELKRGDSAVPVIRFVSASGDHIDFTASQPARYQAGAAVPIFYHPDNPAFADVDTKRARWLGTVLAGAMSVLSFVIALVLTRAARTPA